MGWNDALARRTLRAAGAATGGLVRTGPMLANAHDLRAILVA